MPLDRDLPCARCGYNLRTLLAADACPECGLSISQSLSPDLFENAPRRWLKFQHAGVWIMFASYLLSAIAIVTEIFHSYVPGLPRVALAMLRVAPLVGLAIAVWMLTTQRADRRVKRSGLLVRYGFVGVLVLSVLLPGVEHAGFRSLLGRLGWTLFFSLLVICWIGLGCIQVRIARMLGLPGVAKLIWAATIVWSIALGATSVNYIFREFTDRSLFSRAEPAYVYTLLVGGLLLIASSATVALAFGRRMRIAPSPP